MLKLYPLSQAQLNFLTRSTARINVCEGPVRAGKNFVVNLRFKNYLKTEPYGNTKSDIAFCGATKDSVWRNFLKDLLALIPQKYWSYNSQRGKGRIFGRDFYVFSFLNADDFKVLQGATLGGAVVTEAVHCHKEFLNELLARCSVPGAKLFWDLNPASPTHYIYTDFLTNEDIIAAGDLIRFKFDFDSNLSLTEEYKASLKRYYVPGSLRYKRMIEGLWVAAEGVIYNAFSSDKHVIDPANIPDLELFWLPFDFGIQHPTVFGCLGRKGDKYYLIDEWKHHGDVDGRKTNTQYLKDMLEFMARFPARPHEIIKDPAPIAAAFNVELDQRLHDYSLVMADNALLEGIGTVQRKLENKEFFVSSKCVHTIRGFGSYSWDQKASARTGQDIPQKIDDDEMCMVRYGLHTTDSSYDPMAGWAA